jgi:hypothetical protein
MTDVASPNDIENLLLDYRAMERLQDLVDAEVAQSREIDLWPEHWEKAGAIVVWRCPNCQRLYFNARGPASEVTVYRFERKGL